MKPPETYTVTLVGVFWSAVQLLCMSVRKGAIIVDFNIQLIQMTYL